MTGTDRYARLGRIIGAEMGGGAVALAPGMELADIPGWDSVTLAGVLAEIERETGQFADRDAMDRLTSVDALAALLPEH